MRWKKSIKAVTTQNSNTLYGFVYKNYTCENNSHSSQKITERTKYNLLKHVYFDLSSPAAYSGTDKVFWKRGNVMQK